VLKKDSLTRDRLAAIRAEPSTTPVWITRLPADRADAELSRIARLDSAPLRGWLLAVKDNIDVAGMPTTAAAPRELYTPGEDAPVVAALRAAGAIVAGKTNMDQFATGLVGTRSPYGAPSSVANPELISGGSSSGSAVAVASGAVDIALGTDTAGSGRVPAAFNGIIGIKPTLGLVPAAGVVPAAPSYDAVTVFARDLTHAEAALGVMARGGRAWPLDAPLAAPPRVRLGVPGAAGLEPMSPAWRAVFEAAVEELDPAAFEVVRLDVGELLAAAKLLYEGALLAERTASFGHLLDELGDEADPTVAAVVAGGHRFTAADLVRDQQLLRAAAARAAALWDGVDVLMTPTAPGHPAHEQVAGDPVGVNSWVGTYTNFVNLLDLSAVAMPLDTGPGAPVGVTVVGPAFGDRVLLDVAARLRPDLAPDRPWLPAHHEIVVAGAHRRGGKLEHELVALGARFLRAVRTAPEYGLYRLDLAPPRPGLVRRASGGAAIAAEVWALPVAAVSPFLAGIAAPLGLGTVRLADGSTATGFICEPWGVDGAEDITASGGWLEHLRGA
jgi:allophanate hydrolase